VIVGHKRLAAAYLLGLTSAPVNVATELSEADARV
jgi:ParB-like chromosome segregation protein Spo0J